MYLSKSKELIKNTENLKGIEIIPCTNEEIFILEKSLGRKIPDSLKEFLLWCGKKLVRIPIVNYNDLISDEFKNNLNEVINFHGNKLKLPQELIILQYDGESGYFDFIELNNQQDPIVSRYHEGFKELLNPIYIYSQFNLCDSSPRDNFSKYIFEKIMEYLSSNYILQLNENGELSEFPCLGKQVETLKEKIIINIFSNGNIFKDFPQIILNSKNLYKLVIYGARIENLPNDFKNLKKLENLDLSSNKFEVFPEEIFELHNIWRLVLSYNKINSIPEKIYKLQNLEVFEFSYNPLETLPQSIFKLKKLIYLELNNCGLNEFPFFEFSESNLEYLKINNNYFKSFPKSILSFKNLRYLDISNCNISFLPDEIKKMQNLKTLILGGNNFDSFPKQILQLKNLSELRMDSCNLFNIPDELILLENLETLSIEKNKFTSFPKILLKLKNIASIEIRGDISIKAELKIISESKIRFKNGLKPIRIECGGFEENGIPLWENEQIYIN